MDHTELRNKIENIYIMLLYAITKEDINRVQQYLSGSLTQKYEKLINRNINNNVIQKYGELNVSSVTIVKIEDNLATVDIVAKYIDYKIDRTTRKFLSGETERSSHTIRLLVRCNDGNREIVYRCENCGAPLNINLTGVCPYCNQPFEDEDSLYVIENIID